MSSCECGCGASVAGRFKRGHNLRPGHTHPSWKGGVRHMNGYRLLLLPDHPMADANGCVYEHRFVMSEHLGRTLSPDEHVHHVNSDRLDNRIENLELTDNATHLRHHNAKLDEAKVREIRARLARGETQASLATEYGVTDGAINHIHKHRWWQHVK